MGLNLSAKLSPYMTANAQTDMVANMPKTVTPVKDLLFPPAHQRQKTSPFVKISEVSAQTGAIPLNIRGTQSYAVGGNGSGNQLIEVQPVNPSNFCSAKEVNDLIALGDKESIQQFVQDQEQQLLDVVSNTTETLVRQALSGKISYPVFNGTNVDGKVEIKLGDLAVNDAVDISKADIAVLQNVFAGMYQKQAKTGGGVDIAFLIGTKVYSAILKIAIASGNLANVIMTPTSDGFKFLNQYHCISMPYTYVLPKEGSNEIPVIPENCIQTVDLANPGILFYAAVDDLKANLAPLPFFVKPVDSDDPSGIKFVGQSKPLPAMAMARMTRTTFKTA